MKFSAMNKTAYAKLVNTKRIFSTSRNKTNTKYLPENTSTKYRGSLTLRSPHIKRNTCKLSLSVGISVTKHFKNLNADKKVKSL